MKWWFRFLESKCTCGGRLMAKARFWKFSFSPGATRLRPFASFGNSFAARALSRRLLSLINCDLTKRHFVKLASRVRTSKDCVPTTARRIPISRFDDENERCKASNQPDLLSASFLFMAVYNTFNVQRHLISRPTHRLFRTTAHHLGMRRQLLPHKSGTLGLMFRIARLLSCQCRPSA